EISAAFPDLVEAMDFNGALDGELLAGRPPAHVGAFSDLQQRLNRKTVSARMLRDFPVFMRCYDLLLDGGGGHARPCLFRAPGPARRLRRAPRPRPVRPVAA